MNSGAPGPSKRAMNFPFLPRGLAASLLVSALALGAVGCSSDDGDDGQGSVQVQHYKADNSADGEATKVPVPAACSADDGCAAEDNACDEALGALCKEGTTRTSCVSFGGNFQIGCTPERQ